jgi:hypothetical protein
VQILNSPLHVERAVMTTALYGQDSYAIGRLTVTGGIRWERIEGYLPAQVTGASEYFPDGLVFRGVTINGVVQDYTVRKSFPEVRNNPRWYNFAPRFSGTYDLFGNGRTVIKASWGKYLDQINTGTPPNPNANINQTYAWNDLNGDLNFQRGNAVWDGLRYVGGEFGAQQGGTGGLAVAVFNPSLRRPYREEFTVGLDRELFPGIRGGATYIQRRERDVQGTLDQSMDQWGALYTALTLTEPGRDGCFGTETSGGCLNLTNASADNKQITVYSLNPGATTSQVTVNDDRLAVHFKGLEFTLEKRFSRGWTVLGGYTYSHTTVERTSLSNPNNAFVNADGESGGRRHQLKVNGSYTLPYQIVAGVEYRIQSGLPITRSWNVPQCSTSVTTNCVSQNNLSVNAEPRGTVLLPSLGTLDVRAGRFFNMGKNRFEATMDVYNLTNANTTFGVRTGTGLTNIRVAGDPTAPQTPIQTFLSPTGVLGPRIIRFNITYWFH